MRVLRCDDWTEVPKALASITPALGVLPGEELWYRGANDSRNRLLPSLLWKAQNLTTADLDDLEQRLFFEFQARARELHGRMLTDWDYLFFMRHHNLPTRLLDWTSSFGRAVYFALDNCATDKTSCIWVLNPYSLNVKTWTVRDLVQPKYLTYIDDEFWEYGEALIAEGRWTNNGPVAIYPLQISDRMRAQQGWFTFHGNDRRPLETQFPGCVARVDLAEGALAGAREFLDMAGLGPYAIYPDLDHLSQEIGFNNLATIPSRPAVRVTTTKRRPKKR